MERIIAISFLVLLILPMLAGIRMVRRLPRSGSDRREE